MRKLILTLAIFLATLSALAQGQHLAFMNVPIDGKLEAFKEKMQAMGFVSSDYDKRNVYGMKGKYDGHDCEIFILYSTETNTVCKVVMDYSTEWNWKAIKKNFTSLKKRLDKAYGPSSSDYAQFKSPYREGDKKELSAIRAGYCKYESYWT